VTHCSRHQVANGDGARVLIECLRNPLNGPDTQCWILRAVSNLSSTSARGQNNLREQGGIPAVVDCMRASQQRSEQTAVLEEQEASLQFCACTSLACMATGEAAGECVQEMAELGGLQVLIQAAPALS